MRISIAGIVLVLLFVAGASTGCGAPKKSFEITVQNRSELPVMIWLTKNGPPMENGWLTTEQFLAAPEGTRSPGVELPPGKTADTGKVTGTFPDGTDAVLLVFRTGQPAGERRMPGVTVLLRPGKNHLAVAADEQGALFVSDTVTGFPAPLVTDP
jgi:hypothetical protein